VLSSLLLFAFSSFYSSVTMYTIEDIFSPLDREVEVQTHFSYASSELASPLVYTQASPTTFKIKKSDSSEVVSDKTRSIISSRYTMSEFEKDIEKEPAVVKRGWRFYGTFACLALLNFICAIDATILSVALPVRYPCLCLYALLMNSKDHRHRFERHNCDSGILVRDIFSTDLNGLRAYMGVLFPYHRTKIGLARGTVALHNWNCHCLRR
jgi:hypothetical protein